MRVGTNPESGRSLTHSYGRHRVVIPVHVPNTAGYFLRSLEVLELCLESLWATTRGRVAVTVIANGCCPEAVHVIDHFQATGAVDQVVLNSVNRGKVDSVLGVVRGCYETLFTIADCDVLFLSGWLEAVEELFWYFQEAGVVSPSPNVALHGYHTSATVLESFARGELSLTPVVPEADIDRFEASIGNRRLASAADRAAQFVVERSGVRACVGCGHFIFSIRREALQLAPSQPCLNSGGAKGAEQAYFDAPPDLAGFWRLATAKSYAYHMGNTPEGWMRPELERSLAEQPSVRTPCTLSPDGLTSWPAPTIGWSHRIPVTLRRHLAARVRYAKRAWLQRQLSSTARAGNRLKV